MNSTNRTLVPAILSADRDLAAPENQALEVALSDEPETSAGPVKRLLYTQKEAAECLGASRSTLWRLTKEGIFHPIELTSGTWRYQIAEIEAFAREGRRHKDLRNARPQPRKAGV
jgi:predicted DNA-binding transcriptional regulator AlpA